MWTSILQSSTRFLYALSQSSCTCLGSLYSIARSTEDFRPHSMSSFYNRCYMSLTFSNTTGYGDPSLAALMLTASSYTCSNGQYGYWGACASTSLALDIVCCTQAHSHTWDRSCSPIMLSIHLVYTMYICQNEEKTEEEEDINSDARC